jgi:hypothetical protein
LSVAAVSSLELLNELKFGMCKERKEDDPSRDQGNNTPYVYLRSVWNHRSNLEEIVRLEALNSAWVESLGPE